MKRSIQSLKIIAICLTISLISNAASASIPVSATIPKSSLSLNQDVNLQHDSFASRFESEQHHLPGLKQFGSIRKIIPGSSERIIIHIQDIHMNTEAQSNIAHAIQNLINTGNVDLITLEGAFSPIDLSAFRQFPKQDAVHQVADYLFRKNKISGPILTAFKSKKAIPPIVGIDNKTHYDANVDAVKKSFPEKERIKNGLMTQDLKLRAMSHESMRSELWAFHKNVLQYQDDELSMGEYVDLLLTTHDSELTTLNIFHEALKLERTLNFTQVEHERAIVINKLLSRLKERKTKELVYLSTAFQKGQLNHADFYQYIQNLCATSDISLTRYKAIRDYIQYVLLSNIIDGEKLQNEIRIHEREIYNALSRTTEEKDLIQSSRQLYLQKKLVDFALTKQEWSEYVGATRRVAQVSGAVGRGTASPLHTFENFYKEAEYRDQKMAENLHAAIQQNKPKVTVLVTGGFHTKGITTQLMTHGSRPTIITFVPKITKLESENGSAYLSVFTQEKTPLDKLFKGEALYLPTAPIPTPSAIKILLDLVLLQGTKVSLSVQNAVVTMRKNMSQIINVTVRPKAKRSGISHLSVISSIYIWGSISLLFIAIGAGMGILIYQWILEKKNSRYHENTYEEPWEKPYIHEATVQQLERALIETGIRVQLNPTVTATRLFNLIQEREFPDISWLREQVLFLIDNPDGFSQLFQQPPATHHQLTDFYKNRFITFMESHEAGLNDENWKNNSHFLWKVRELIINAKKLNPALEIPYQSWADHMTIREFLFSLSMEFNRQLFVDGGFFLVVLPKSFSLVPVNVKSIEKVGEMELIHLIKSGSLINSPQISTKGIQIGPFTFVDMGEWAKIAGRYWDFLFQSSYEGGQEELHPFFAYIRTHYPTPAPNQFILNELHATEAEETRHGRDTLLLHQAGIHTFSPQFLSHGGYFWVRDDSPLQHLAQSLDLVNWHIPFFEIHGPLARYQVQDFPITDVIFDLLELHENPITIKMPRLKHQLVNSEDLKWAQKMRIALFLSKLMGEKPIYYIQNPPTIQSFMDALKLNANELKIDINTFVKNIYRKIQQDNFLSEKEFMRNNFELAQNRLNELKKLGSIPYLQQFMNQTFHISKNTYDKNWAWLIEHQGVWGAIPFLILTPLFQPTLIPVLWIVTQGISAFIFLFSHPDKKGAPFLIATVSFILNTTLVFNLTPWTVSASFITSGLFHFIINNPEWIKLKTLIKNRGIVLVLLAPLISLYFKNPWGLILIAGSFSLDFDDENPLPGFESEDGRLRIWRTPNNESDENNTANYDVRIRYNRFEYHFRITKIKITSSNYKYDRETFQFSVNLPENRVFTIHTDPRSPVVLELSDGEKEIVNIGRAEVIKFNYSKYIGEYFDDDSLISTLKSYLIRRRINYLMMIVDKDVGEVPLWAQYSNYPNALTKKNLPYKIPQSEMARNQVFIALRKAITLFSGFQSAELYLDHHGNKEIAKIVYRRHLTSPTNRIFKKGISHFDALMGLAASFGLLLGFLMTSAMKGDDYNNAVPPHPDYEPIRKALNDVDTNLGIETESIPFSHPQDKPSIDQQLWGVYRTRNSG